MDRLRAMRAFVAAADTGSFSEAAALMQTKQSTISKWIARLEEDAGVRLIQRTTRAQHLTDAGELFYASAREILRIHEDTQARLQAASSGPRGVVRVSAPAVFGASFVVPLMDPFLRAFPQVEVSLSLSDDYVDMVGQGVDVAVRLGRPADSSLRAITLGRSPRVLVASAAYLDTRGPLRTPADLRGHDCLVHSGRHTPTTWSFQGAGRTWTHQASGRIGCNHSGALTRLAAQGHGVALVAQLMVRAQLESGQLVRVLEDFDASDATLQLLHVHSPYPKPQVRAMLDHLSQGLGPLVLGR